MAAKNTKTSEQGKAAEADATGQNETPAADPADQPAAAGAPRTFETQKFARGDGDSKQVAYAGSLAERNELLAAGYRPA